MPFPYLRNASDQPHHQEFAVWNLVWPLGFGFGDWESEIWNAALAAHH